MFKLTTVAVALLLVATPAFAIDCLKAETELEKFICADAAMKQADDQMSAAYKALLAKTKYHDFREAIIRSQKRWLANRTPDGKIWAPGAGDENADKLGPKTKKFIIEASQNRKDFLESKDLMIALEAQRAERQKDGAGQYEGYSSECSFTEPPWGEENGYMCLSTISRQKGKRVCTTATNWASGHFGYVQVVSEVRDRNLKDTATCETGANRNTCPSEDGAEAGAKWMLNPTELEVQIPDAKELWKYDPDFDGSVYTDWMESCLNSTVYPPANQ